MSSGSAEEAHNTPQFEVISAHIVENEENKRHVVYTIQVRHTSRRDDSRPVTIERRYTQFLNLYNRLNEANPDLMVNVNFPKKALMGNFDNKLIGSRTSAFENLLKIVMSEEKLRSSKALLSFLQDPELIKAKLLISHHEFATAMPMLENIFTLLNNVYTDRSPQVLLVLCRLLCCSICIIGSPQAEKWADLALHRFEGVSDSDLLLLYIPLLNICKKVWILDGRNKTFLEERLEELKRRGINTSDCMSLLDAIMKVELLITGTPT